MLVLDACGWVKSTINHINGAVNIRVVGSNIDRYRNSLLVGSGELLATGASFTELTVLKLLPIRYNALLCRLLCKWGSCSLKFNTGVKLLLHQFIYCVLPCYGECGLDSCCGWVQIYCNYINGAKSTCVSFVVTLIVTGTSFVIVSRIVVRYRCIVY
jgi:hypothetical protein